MIWFLLFLLVQMPFHARGQYDSAVGYLAKFGYIPPEEVPPLPPPGVASDTPAQAFSPTDLPDNIAKAVKQFQKFAGLRATGDLDEETLELMGKPRCGVVDVSSKATVSYTEPHGNLSNYKADWGYPWEKRTLTYRVLRYSSKISNALVDRDIRKAFDLWSGVTNMNFLYKASGDIDIKISFDTYDHGDGEPFDGRGGTLAHAYYPHDGDVHIDDTENWTADSYGGTDFLQTFTHEIGHSLGLSHSRVPGAVMAPFASSYDPNFKLHPDDIAGIQSVYGVPPVTTTPSTVATTTPSSGSTYPSIPSFLCPDRNSNTRGRYAAETLYGIQSWSECSLRCQQKPGCRYWTWHHEGAVGYAYNCVIMEDVDAKVYDPNSVSGSKKCTCPKFNTNLQRRENMERIYDINSWKECARLCSDSGSCNHWVWNKPGAGDYALICALMASYGNEAADNNSIAGDEVCY